MKYIKSIILLWALISFFSCSNNDNNFISYGTVNYYPSFLWEESKITPVTKTIEFDFSPDAKNDADSFAEFQFVDNNGKAIPTSEMQVNVDGIVAENNVFRVYSKTDSTKLEFIFSPNAKTGKHQGFLKLINHKLDRLDSQQLSIGEKTDVLQWTLIYEKNMNPLAKVLMWITIIVLSLILTWILIIRNIVFPTFRAIRKTVIIPNQAPIAINFKGARMVVLSNAANKQSFWNKLCTGKIIYKQNSTLTAPIIFKPRARGKKIFFISQSTNYTCSPNPIDVRPSVITDMTYNQRFTIQ